MSEDTILTIICVGFMAGAFSIGHFFKNTRGMTIFKKLMSPFTWLKDAVDPNHWAEKIGNKTGVYDKAMESPLRKWSLELEGWQWWTYQLGIGLLFFIIIEFFLNMIGMTIVPW